jgi:hypothetical protein
MDAIVKRSEASQARLSLCLTSLLEDTRAVSISDALMMADADCGEQGRAESVWGSVGPSGAR